MSECCAAATGNYLQKATSLSSPTTNSLFQPCGVDEPDIITCRDPVWRRAVLIVHYMPDHKKVFHLNYELVLNILKGKIYFYQCYLFKFSHREDGTYCCNTSFLPKIFLPRGVEGFSETRVSPCVQCAVRSALPVFSSLLRPTRERNVHLADSKREFGVHERAIDQEMP